MKTIKKYYVYTQSSKDDGYWCSNILSKMWFEWWVGIKTWYQLNPEQIYTITIEMPIRKD